MSEENLISLGFEKVDVTVEESGYSKDWYYYTYDFSKGFGLISCDNDEAEKDGWYVEIFEAEDIRFTSYQDLSTLIRIIKKGIK